MPLSALKRQPAEQLATEALREAILTGVLNQGERLTEVAVAEQFGVSRGTVRMALNQLSSEGLVVLTPYTGWSVIQFTTQDLWEIYTLRGALESMAANLAAERLDVQGAKRLEEAADRLFGSAASNNIRQIKLDDFALHRCIVDLSCNSHLLTHYRMVEQKIRMFISSTYQNDHPRFVVEHHRPLVQAILNRKRRLASRLCEHHCLSEGDRLLGLPLKNNKLE